MQEYGSLGNVSINSKHNVFQNEHCSTHKQGRSVKLALPVFKADFFFSLKFVKPYLNFLSATI